MRTIASQNNLVLLTRLVCTAGSFLKNSYWTRPKDRRRRSDNIKSAETKQLDEGIDETLVSNAARIVAVVSWRSIPKYCGMMPKLP